MRKKNLLLILLTTLLISQQYDAKSVTYWNGQTFYVELPGGGQNADIR